MSWKWTPERHLFFIWPYLRVKLRWAVIILLRYLCALIAAICHLKRKRTNIPKSGLYICIVRCRLIITIISVFVEDLFIYTISQKYFISVSSNLGQKGWHMLTICVICYVIWFLNYYYFCLSVETIYVKYAKAARKVHSNY